ncbi:MAG: hypothetical protein RLZZ44_4, partial [Bacteroidota bacterium]
MKSNKNTYSTSLTTSTEVAFF